MLALAAGRRVGVLRDRVLELPRPLLVLLGDLDVDVLVLRDPGGEDVRVAMVVNLLRRHTSHRDHTSACRAAGSGRHSRGCLRCTPCGASTDRQRIVPRLWTCRQSRP
ncbi:hypothetical protein GCM10012276_25380 [Nocardioides deserti]|nr:hypothetical protein GCM10012276_25380 [Nocardioides deserti]